MSEGPNDNGQKLTIGGNPAGDGAFRRPTPQRAQQLEQQLKPRINNEDDGSRSAFHRFQGNQNAEQQNPSNVPSSSSSNQPGSFAVQSGRRPEADIPIPNIPREESVAQDRSGHIPAGSNQPGAAAVQRGRRPEEVIPGPNRPRRGNVAQRGRGRPRGAGQNRRRRPRDNQGEPIRRVRRIYNRMRPVEQFECDHCHLLFDREDVTLHTINVLDVNRVKCAQEWCNFHAVTIQHQNDHYRDVHPGLPISFEEPVEVTSAMIRRCFPTWDR